MSDNNLINPEETASKRRVIHLASKSHLANPAPFGFWAFAMTTVLFNIHNAGFYPLSPMLLAMGIFCGGISQIFAGIIEFKRGSAFGALAFTSFGFFWLTLMFTLIKPWGLEATSDFSMGIYFIVWGVFTFFIFVNSFKGNKATRVVFAALTVLYVLLAARDLTGSEFIGTIAGLEGIFCGLCAAYVALAETLKEIWGKTVLPLG
ncbi:MAG: acetate uptake transporter [Leptospirales bacterium]|nr:acetate uptake transporter [Leptospirales bacterium]